MYTSKLQIYADNILLYKPIGSNALDVANLQKKCQFKCSLSEALWPVSKHPKDQVPDDFLISPPTTY